MLVRVKSLDTSFSYLWTILGNIFSLTYCGYKIFSYFFDFFYSLYLDRIVFTYILMINIELKSKRPRQPKTLLRT